MAGRTEAMQKSSRLVKIDGGNGGELDGMTNGQFDITAIYGGWQDGRDCDDGSLTADWESEGASERAHRAPACIYFWNPEGHLLGNAEIVVHRRGRKLCAERMGRRQNIEIFREVYFVSRVGTGTTTAPFDMGVGEIDGKLSSNRTQNCTSGWCENISPSSATRALAGKR